MNHRGAIISFSGELDGVLLPSEDHLINTVIAMKATLQAAPVIGQNQWNACEIQQENRVPYNMGSRLSLTVVLDSTPTFPLTQTTVPCIGSRATPGFNRRKSICVIENILQERANGESRAAMRTKCQLYNTSEFARVLRSLAHDRSLRSRCPISAVGRGPLC